MWCRVLGGGGSGGGLWWPRFGVDEGVTIWSGCGGRVCGGAVGV